MNASVYNLPLGHITSYLESEGWELVSDNERWYVFEGYEDLEGNPFEIVLPKNINAPDYRTYVQHTVNILSSLKDKAPQTIADDILLYDRDILMIRILENVDTTSIPIHLASKQIPALKQLIAHAASLEQDENDDKPHFIQTAPTADKMVRHYRFGHTFSGSFGYRIESPIKGKVHYDMFKDKPAILPLERRIMERIIKGLATTEEAVKLRDVKLLINGCNKGFNANMCDAILKMSDEQKGPIEYRIKWSNKIHVSNDLKHVKVVRIQKMHFDYLETASKQLKEREPESVTIEGCIIDLHSSDDPKSEDAKDRSITVQWYQRQGRPQNVRITLQKDNYIKAIQAHSDWKIISVNGKLQRKGSQWQLSEPREFKILR